MPAKTFLIPHKVNKDIVKLPLRIQNKIDQAFNQIKDDPTVGAKLQGELNDYYKYRLGDYRIIYWFDTKLSAVQIMKVEHRQGVYR